MKGIAQSVSPQILHHKSLSTKLPDFINLFDFVRFLNLKPTLRMNIMILIESLQELEKLIQSPTRFQNIALYQNILAEDSKFLDNYKE